MWPFYVKVRAGLTLIRAAAHFHVIHIHIKVNSMSIWFYRKDDDGKKSIYTVSFPFEVLLVIIGVMAALLLKCCL